jgi:hypothetical protein
MFFTNVNMQFVQSFAYQSGVPWRCTLSATWLCEPAVNTVHKVMQCKGTQLSNCFNFYDSVSGRVVENDPFRERYHMLPLNIFSVVALIQHRASRLYTWAARARSTLGSDDLCSVCSCFRSSMDAVNIPFLTFSNGCRMPVVGLGTWMVSSPSRSCVRSDCRFVCHH